MKTTLLAAMAFPLTAPAFAQSTLIVGAGGYATIADAMAAAVSGDEVVVLDGTYPPFDLDEVVTLRALNPGSVVITPGIVNITLPADQHAHVVGLHIPTVEVAPNSIVTFEDCTFANAPAAYMMTLHAGSFAHCERCTFTGQQVFGAIVALVNVYSATASMTDCTLTGTSAVVLGSPVTVRLNTGSTLLASNTSITGGTPQDPAPALQVFGADAYFTDSSLLSAPGHCAVFGGSLFLERCIVDASCPSFPSPPQLGISMSGPVELGQPLSLAFRGEPNQFLLVFGSDAIDTMLAAELRTPFLLAAAGCFPAAALMTDGNGDASITWQLPAIPPAAGLGLWLQGVCGASFPLAASPVVGGIAR